MAMMEDNENKKECKKECKPEYTCSKCKVVLVKKTSTTVKNPNRDFYCCPDKKCSEFFVQWVDQSGMIKKNVSTAAVCNRCKSGCYIRNSKSRTSNGRAYYACASSMCSVNFVSWVADLKED